MNYVSHNYYLEKNIAFLTKHGKEMAIIPLFEKNVFCHIKHVMNYDTDQLGTFSRDVQRFDNQLVTARNKARIGMEISELKLGLASEGAFGSDPFTGFIPWNRELIVLIDDEAQTEIIGEAQGPGNHHSINTTDWSEAMAFAKKIGFPDQQIIMRPDHENTGRIIKNINSWHLYEKFFSNTKSYSTTGHVFIETDGRAYANPMRMKMITEAAKDLLKKMQSCCPNCGIPGFAVTKRFRGLPCGNCKGPTKMFYKDLYACQKCGGHREIKCTDQEWAYPLYCDFCNP
ncbi:DUF6671 family protein [Acidithiobacillus sulfurivorans]|uniref:DUF6671 domain-containing protein n=1 Tax=Acidithiobacillus sulfurivorans TaxID=1958756 RepID=A0ABS5ZW68_9PROT|nr:DUF6671 family protein [Acidithiobacillus sulfurivorans]MBU2759458.1 hypothetical protein [Acidithiobacillus sulfurivorans]